MLKKFLLLIFTFFFVDSGIYADKVLIGTDTFNGGRLPGNKNFEKALDMLGIDFIIWHIIPLSMYRKIGNIKGDALPAVEFCKKKGYKYAFNTEQVNYRVSYGNCVINGHDWFTSFLDGMNRFDLPDWFLNDVKGKDFLGVIYDESEHVQGMNNSATIDRPVGNVPENKKSKYLDKIGPYWANTEGMTLQQAYEAVYRSAKRVVDYYKKFDTPLITEHVFPIFFHTYARAGIIPCPKMLKESWNPVMISMALGAIKEYKLPQFWVEVDQWWYDVDITKQNMGHSLEEFRSGLLFAYWMGATHIYNEGADEYLFTNYDHQWKKIELKKDGETFIWFTKKYIPKHPRPYSFKEFKPEIAIIRFPDGCWGQNMGLKFIPDHLYGASNLHSTFETMAWFKAWNLLSHGWISIDGVSWNCTRSVDYAEYLDSPEKHTSFCPVNNVVVYDHRVDPSLLKNIKLFILTGITITKKTLKGVDNIVKNKGAIAISLPNLCPAEIKSVFSGKPVVIKRGKGKWIITEDFTHPLVKKEVKHLLGKEDEIRYVFGEYEVIFKIDKKDAHKIIPLINKMKE